MKKISLMLAGCLLATCISAQYGHRTYPHSPSVLSSAKVAKITPGFVTSGYYGNTTASLPDFVIEKTDADGDFTLWTDFGNQYIILDNPCVTTPPTTRAYNCTGTSVIETFANTSGTSYAMAGCYSGGVFFALFDISGNVLYTYRWPYNGAGINGPQPFIVESPSTPGDFYICGGVNSGAYVVRINSAGPVWERKFDGTPIQPRGLLESPYDPNEVAVVGMALNNGFAADEAFFMKLDNSNQGAIVAGFPKFYSDNTSGDEWFACIQPAFSPIGGQGYVVGGRQHSPGMPDFRAEPWVLKLDPNGNVIWSTLILPNTTGSAMEINDIVERFNPTGQSHYEYYCTAGCTDGNSGADNIGVWKLDQNGWNTLVSPNEFVYPVGSGHHLAQKYASVQIELVGNGSNLGDGIQTWSTENAGTFHFYKAYYNGVAGCQEKIWINKLYNGPGQSPNLLVTSYPMPAYCPYGFDIQFFQTTMQQNPCGFNGPVPGGSNARTAQPTGIASNANVEEGTGVYPNPVTDKVVVSFNAADNSTVKIDVCNALGQVVKTVTTTKQSSGNYKEEIDFSNMQLKAGIYFINVSAGTTTNTHKVVYTGSN